MQGILRQLPCSSLLRGSVRGFISLCPLFTRYRLIRPRWRVGSAARKVSYVTPVNQIQPNPSDNQGSDIKISRPGQFRNFRSYNRLAQSLPDHPDPTSDPSTSVNMISLAHELSAGLDPTYSGQGARALADEFGLNLDERENSSDGRYGGDEVDGNMVDQRVDGLIDRLDVQLDLDLADPFDLDPGSLPVQGQSLGDELAYDAFNPSSSDHPTFFLSKEFDLGTHGEDEVDDKEYLEPQTPFGDSGHPFHEFTSLPCSPASITSSSSLESINSSSSSPSSSLSTLLSQILLPPSFLPLLRKDDQSFLLESASKSFALKIDASIRQREGMQTEWNAFDAGDKKRFANGFGYRSVDFSNLTKESAGYADPDSSLVLDGLPDSSFTSDGLSSPAARQTILSPIQSPLIPSQPNSHFTDPLILGDPSLPSPSSSSSYTQAILRRVEELRFLTDSLISSLSTVGDTSQITLSGATEAGRRLRSIRATLGGIKSEEASWERSREEIQSWEEQEEKRTDMKVAMRTELNGFRKAMEDFEAKTITIRTTHENFLRGTYI